MVTKDYTELESGLEALLSEVGLNDLEMPLSDLQKLSRNYAREAGVTEATPPETAGELTREAVKEDLGESTVTMNPEHEAELKRRQNSYQELSRLVNAGHITRARAAQIFEERHGKR